MTEFSSKINLKINRLKKISIEAIEQSNSISLPEISEVQTLKNVLEEWDENRIIFFCDEKGGNRIFESQLKLKKFKKIAIFVGPIGGWSSSDRELFKNKKFSKLVWVIIFSRLIQRNLFIILYKGFAKVTVNLSKENLIEKLSSGCKNKDDWRIGTEHEKFGFKKKDLSPINFNDIQNIFLNLSSRFNWIKIEENGNIIGLKKNKSSITLEPGGQIELSGAPLKVYLRLVKKLINIMMS